MPDEPISHTRAFIKNFVIPSRRARLLYLLDHQRSIRGFSDQSEFIESKMIRIVPTKPSRASKRHELVAAELKRRGASELACGIFWQTPTGDGPEEPLEDLLKENVGWETWAIISCIPGKLAYWEGEGKNNRFILCD